MNKYMNTDKVSSFYFDLHNLPSGAQISVGLLTGVDNLRTSQVQLFTCNLTKTICVVDGASKIQQEIGMLLR